MQPKKFNEVNVIYGEGQPEYLPLPAHKTESGEVTTCWELSPEEKKQVQETGVIWLSMLTFNHPLQPVLLKTEKPDFENENRK